MSKVIFLPHGGGPMPALGDPGHAGLVKSLQGLQGDITNAKALLVITAHWEEQAVAISAWGSHGGTESGGVLMIATLYHKAPPILWGEGLSCFGLSHFMGDGFQ